MTRLLLILLAGSCIFLLAWGMGKSGRICEFPFLAGATFAGFVLPQAVGITLSEPLAPAGLDAALAMSILCAGMCYLGYVVSDTPMAAPRWEFDNDRLLVVSGVLSAIGAFFFFLIGGLPEEQVTGAWTGPVIIYYFFAQLLRYGFALAFLLYAKMRSKLALAIVLFNCLVLFDMIVLRGRRSYAIEFFLVIVCTFWFVRRKTLPRWCMLVILAAGILAVAGTCAYRTTIYQDQTYGGTLKHEVPWEEVLKIDFIEVFLAVNQEESHEFRNCMYSIRTTDTFDWGLSYWNEFVFIYVPAQVVGSEFKTSLQFDLQAEYFDPNSPGGTTITGMGDSFQAFGWFGCFVFFLIAFLLRKLFETAQLGYLAAQLVYMLIITNTMICITHHTKWFFTPLVHMAVFLLPGLLSARKPTVAKPPETNF